MRLELLSIQGFVLSTFLRIIFGKLVFQTSDKTNECLEIVESAYFGNSDQCLDSGHLQWLQLPDANRGAAALSSADRDYPTMTRGVIALPMAPTL